MADLVNEFSWSFSRQQVFEACRRRYYYRYYQFWGGWDRRAPEPVRLAYVFSKMQSLPMLIGIAVHETLENLLKSQQRGRPLGNPVDLMRARLNQTWQDSRRERWREVGAKRCPPLFEHYYEVEVSKERLQELRDKAIACIQRFLESDLYATIQRCGVSSWRSIEELAILPLGEDRCFVSPDFAFDRDEETWLLDWKTGRPRASMKLQLLSYALFARERWDVPVGRLRAFDCFLAEGQLDEIEITEASLAEAEREIRDQITAMKATLADPAANEARKEDMPPTTDGNECRRCFFRAICDEPAI